MQKRPNFPSFRTIVCSKTTPNTCATGRPRFYLLVGVRPVGRRSAGIGRRCRRSAGAFLLVATLVYTYGEVNHRSDHGHSHLVHIFPTNYISSTPSTGSFSSKFGHRDVNSAGNILQTRCKRNEDGGLEAAKHLSSATEQALCCPLL